MLRTLPAKLTDLLVSLQRLHAVGVDPAICFATIPAQMPNWTSSHRRPDRRVLQSQTQAFVHSSVGYQTPIDAESTLVGAWSGTSNRDRVIQDVTLKDDETATGRVDLTDSAGYNTRRNFLGGLGALLTTLLPSTLAGERTERSRIVRVGPREAIKTLTEAAAQAKDGDTIEVAAGEYPGNVAIWSQDRIAIRAAGGRVRIDARGRDSEGKGIFVVRGGAITIEGFDFARARVPDQNGAGIRLERGQLIVRSCLFQNNESGILTGNDPSIELTIVESSFVANGAGDGYSHNLYAGSIARLTVTGSYFARSNRGHLLKSRARESLISYSRLTGEDGTSSYEVEFPNGGRATLLGNLVEQGPNTENSTIVSFGAEGYKWPTNELRMAFNTVVNDRPQGGIFVAVAPGAGKVELSNNLWVGRGNFNLSAPHAEKGNAIADRNDFADPDHFNYHLRFGSARVGLVGAYGTLSPETLRPHREYAHPHALVELEGLTALTPTSPGAFQRLAP